MWSRGWLASAASFDEALPDDPVTRFENGDVVPPCSRPWSGLPSGQPEVEAMNRRAFVTGLGAVLAAPRGVEAQRQYGMLRRRRIA